VFVKAKKIMTDTVIDWLALWFISFISLFIYVLRPTGFGYQPQKSLPVVLTFSSQQTPNCHHPQLAKGAENCRHPLTHFQVHNVLFCIFIIAKFNGINPLRMTSS